MGSILDSAVKEDCLEEAALSRGLNGVREQLSGISRRRAFQAKGAPKCKEPEAK